MRTAEDRSQRHSQRSRARSHAGRVPGRFLRTAVLAACAAALLGGTPAQAGTGGASTLADLGPPSGQSFVFGPLRSAGATWYGPGFYGRRTACGQVLRPTVMGVAHRRLPCGTVVKFVYQGRRIVTSVIDRGPYTRGYSWDLTNGARRALGLRSSVRIRYAVARNFARG